MRTHISTTCASLFAGAALAACAADSTGPGNAGRQQMTVSFATGAAVGASASRGAFDGTLRAITSTSGTDVLVITRARLVVARLELVRAGATCADTAAAGDDHGRDDNCAELELAPSVIDLPVDGSITTALNVTVPAGTYSALEAKIRPIDLNRGHDGAGSAAFLSAHPELAGVSVRVEGTFNGKAFTYTGAPRAEFETVFNPPLTVGDNGANITVHVDLATWFKSSSGTLIDPATANAGGANAALVGSNIKRSMRAFHDDDHDGHDDHGDHGAGHG